MIDVKKHPALHAILHRYGISPGTTLEQQNRARAECEEIVAELAKAKAVGVEQMELARLRLAQRNLACDEAAADAWIWGDDGDAQRIESMGEEMVILMTAGQLRSMLRERLHMPPPPRIKVDGNRVFVEGAHVRHIPSSRIGKLIDIEPDQPNDQGAVSFSAGTHEWLPLCDLEHAQL